LTYMRSMLSAAELPVGALGHALAAHIE
jgi:hypothetical protein